MAGKRERGWRCASAEESASSPFPECLPGGGSQERDVGMRGAGVGGRLETVSEGHLSLP